MPKSGPDRPELSERQREILQAVVEDYIETAEPVGSRSLTKRNRGIDLSPATVRNAMGDLEDLGYLVAPHASAGRVPTPLAFRVYVERLASRGRISPREREVITAITASNSNTREISQVLQEAGRVLSSLSNQAAFVLLPRLDTAVFAEIEFVPIRDRSVLAIFVAKSGLLQHRVLEVDFALDRDELRRMSNYLKSLLDGKSLNEVRAAIVAAMRSERAAADELMRNALMLGEQTLSLSPQNPEDGVLVEGERTLFDQPEFSDIGKMRTLLRAFEEKTILLRLLDAATIKGYDAQARESESTQIVFGVESTVREAKELAVVLTSYTSASGVAAGQLGIVGPLRMDYSRVIPLVELTAGALSRSFCGEPDPIATSDKKPTGSDQGS